MAQRVLRSLSGAVSTSLKRRNASVRLYLPHVDVRVRDVDRTGLRALVPVRSYRGLIGPHEPGMAVKLCRGHGQLIAQRIAARVQPLDFALQIDTTGSIAAVGRPVGPAD